MVTTLFLEIASWCRGWNGWWDCCCCYCCCPFPAATAAAARAPAATLAAAPAAPCCCCCWCCCHCCCCSPADCCCWCWPCCYCCCCCCCPCFSLLLPPAAPCCCPCIEITTSPSPLIQQLRDMAAVLTQAQSFAHVREWFHGQRRHANPSSIHPIYYYISAKRHRIRCIAYGWWRFLQRSSRSNKNINCFPPKRIIESTYYLTPIHQVREHPLSAK